MTVIALHPGRDEAEMVAELDRMGFCEALPVTGVDSLDAVRKIQACADAAGVAVRWEFHRHGSEARVHFQYRLQVTS